MRNEGWWFLLRRRGRAFLGATIVVAALWIMAVISVTFLASSSPHHDDERLGKAGRIVIRQKAGRRLVFLHHSGGNAFGFEAWHKVAMVLILVTLTAIAVAAIDGLRRKFRRARRSRTV